ncbi:MAG: site-specific DNA-methyltransferase [Candidatus Thorarchaeota archaeon]|nr:site-specific DNA-methyltransferase [Candidatus Thorarchaeota archaeon]
MDNDGRCDNPVEKDGVHLYNCDVMELYDKWPSPTVIISDGAYGLAQWTGDPRTAHDLAEWYEPHIKKWSEHATPLTSLWFWNREIGWAKVHPILEKYGWEYVSCNVWDKGIAHVAGNSNTETLRQFPVVTEVCVLYIKKAEFQIDGEKVSMQRWLRHEWERSGIPLYKANEACGVKNAATRKYLTKDHLFYFPPPDAFSKMVKYVNKYGDPSGRPYFSLDGIRPLTKAEWQVMRSKFYCEVGVTNVWRTPSLHSSERMWAKSGKALHPNQKPLELIKLIIRATSDENDIVWEPFGGLCTGAVAALELGRQCYSAEINVNLFKMATERLMQHDQETYRKGAIGLETFLSMDECEKDADSST